ncbi:MAG: hypothetical protein P1P84_10875 [Deferrisomatales bacterium]|nr:hypothetical protein [Deferrisomatales bacterium]
MDDIATLFSLSLLTLLGVYVLYWTEGRRRDKPSPDTPASPRPRQKTPLSERSGFPQTHRRHRRPPSGPSTSPEPG